MSKALYRMAEDEYGSDATAPIMSQPPAYPMMTPTTVIVQQPNQQQTFYGGRQWSSGLFSCCDDMESCCCVLFFGPCYLKCLFSKYGECCCTTCCVPHPAYSLRLQHRNRHKIAGTILNDCCTATFCWMCTVCQMKRDIDYVMASKGTLAM